MPDYQLLKRKMRQFKRFRFVAKIRRIHEKDCRLYERLPLFQILLEHPPEENQDWNSRKNVPDGSTSPRMF